MPWPEEMEFSGFCVIIFKIPEDAGSAHIVLGPVGAILAHFESGCWKGT